MKLKANERDREIGRRIRATRLAAGVTLEGLALPAGMSYQNLQRIEKGETRALASQVDAFAQLLAVSPALFFEPFHGEIGHGNTSDAAQLIDALRTIESARLRRRLVNLVITIGRELDLARRDQEDDGD